jgi:hypothetical protein
MPLHIVASSSSDLGPHAQVAAANPATLGVQALAAVFAAGVAARTGVFGELANGRADVDELADRLSLAPGPLRVVLDVLVGQGLIDYRAPDYVLAEGARPWFDPDSPTAVTTAMARTIEQAALWADLERIVTGSQTDRTDRAVIRPAPSPADVERAWLRNTRAELEAARLRRP